MIEALTRAGKGVNSMVPTLLAWRHPAQVYVLKGELFVPACAEARKFLLLLRGPHGTPRLVSPLSDQEPIQGMVVFGGGLPKDYSQMYSLRL